jgi:hypothetical protein
MSLASAIAQAKRQFTQLTGLEAETVSGLERNGDGDTWVVRLEALELERVPSTMDVLATYELKVSEDGELLGFRRQRRYSRGSVDGD